MNKLVITACKIIKVLINATASLSPLLSLAFSPSALHHKRQGFIYTSFNTLYKFVSLFNFIEFYNLPYFIKFCSLFRFLTLSFKVFLDL